MSTPNNTGITAASTEVIGDTTLIVPSASAVKNHQPANAEVKPEAAPKAIARVSQLPPISHDITNKIAAEIGNAHNTTCKAGCLRAAIPPTKSLTPYAAAETKAKIKFIGTH